MDPKGQLLIYRCDNKTFALHGYPFTFQCGLCGKTTNKAVQYKGILIPLCASYNNGCAWKFIIFKLMGYNFLHETG